MLIIGISERGFAMLSIEEREKRKLKLSKRGEPKIFEELYADFAQNGYSKELADRYAAAFITDQKKPLPFDYVQVARLYDRINEPVTAALYLDMLEDRKLSSDERFIYCTEALKNKSMIGNWRDAVDFRTSNIDFLQKYAHKAGLKMKSELYIVLALVDCVAGEFAQGFKLLTGFGYKPCGKNDVTLLEILTTGVYICAKSGDRKSLGNAIENAHSALGLFTVYPFLWSKEYFEQCIENAANGIIP